MNQDPNSISDSIQTLIESTRELEPASRWQQLCEQLGQYDPSPATYRQVWDEVFSNWTVDDKGPRPMWVPGLIDDTNLAQWMRHTQTNSYEEFRVWSVANRELFWKQSIENLNLQFATEPKQTLDVSQGTQQANWLVGSEFNIGESCFQADDDSVAIIQGNPDGTRSTTTVAQLNQQVSQIASSLINAGFQPGDAIAVFMPMTDLSVAIYLGMVRAGLAVVSIADSFAPPEIENRLRISNAKAVFTYDHQVRAGRELPLYETVCKATELPAIVIAFGGELKASLRDQDSTWTDFLVETGQSFEPHLAGPDHLINILFSSGTTGDPKAIPWTQLTPIKCAVDGYCHHNLKPGDVVCWPTNLGWMMGPWLIFATLLNRGTIALFGDAPMSAAFGQFVQDAKVNMLGVVPTIVKAWRGSQCMEEFDWTSIKVFSSTGESSQADDMFYLSSLAQMRPVIEYCGGTEIGGGYITSTVVQPNAPATFSTPALGLDIEILNEEGQPTDSGELFIVPPSIGLSSSLLNRDHFETYYADTPSTDKNSALRRHGDHMTMLPGGYYVAGGRVDDTMNLGGIKTSSAELERVMNQIDGVKETAAIAVSRAGGPNNLEVFAVLETNLEPQPLIDDMNKRIKAQLNPLFKVRSVHIIESMPRTASGKVMRRKLREQAQAIEPATS